MRARRAIRLVGAALAVVGATAGAPTTVGASPPTTPASFEGEVIDLADGWGDARACTVDAAGARCYRTEAAMNAAEDAGTLLLALCSNYTTLYSGASYTGSVLSFNERGVTHNLAGYSFDNITSSFKVGACDARLYDTTAGGTLYSQPTTAGTWSPSMASGWDNRVGSIYID